MAHDYHELKEMTLTQLRELAKGIDFIAHTEDPEEIEDACSILKKKVNVCLTRIDTSRL